MKILSLEQMEVVSGGCSAGFQKASFVIGAICFAGSMTGVGLLIFGPAAGGLLIAQGVCAFK